MGDTRLYTVTVEASFSFDVTAQTEEQAAEMGRATLAAYDPLDDHGPLSPFLAPWIEPAGRDEGFPSLEVTDVFPEDDRGAV